MLMNVQRTRMNAAITRCATTQLVDTIVHVHQDTLETKPAKVSMRITAKTWLCGKTEEYGTIGHLQIVVSLVEIAFF